MERETIEPLPGVVISLPGTESTGFFRVGDLVRQMIRALMERDRQQENDHENHH